MLIARDYSLAVIFSLRGNLAIWQLQRIHSGQDPGWT